MGTRGTLSTFLIANKVPLYASDQAGLLLAKLSCVAVMCVGVVCSVLKLRYCDERALVSSVSAMCLSVD